MLMSSFNNCEDEIFIMLGVYVFSVIQMWVSKSLIDGIKIRKSRLINRWLIFTAFVIVCDVMAIVFTLHIFAIPGTLFCNRKYIIFNYNH